MEFPLPSCSHPCTPEPECDRSDLQPNAPPSGPASFVEASDTAPPRTDIGSLDLKPCSVEEYLDIDASVYGRYEYVEGILVALPMSEGPHDNIAKFLQNHGTARYLRGQTKYPPASQESVAIPRSPPSPGKPPLRRTIRRPDVSTAAPLSPSRRSQLSPKSRRISNPVAGQVQTAVEITSHNESTDTDVKVAEYEKAKVDKYIIINRDANCKEEGKKDQRVEVYDRDSNTNRWGPKQVYRGASPADLGPFGSHKPQSLFNDPDPDSPLRKVSNELEHGKKAREDAKEARRREEKARQDAKESRRREEESRRREEKAREDAKEARRREEKAREDAKEARRREEKAREDAKEAREDAKEARRREEEARVRKWHYKSIAKKFVPKDEMSNSSGSRNSSKTTSPVKKKPKSRR